jgi:hypothetical protein
VRWWWRSTSGTRIDSYQRETCSQRSIEQRLAFLKFAPVLHISALKRQGLGPVWKAIARGACLGHLQDADASACTRLLQEAVEHQQPPRAGRFRPKLRYAHQGGMNPPVVVIHGNSLDAGARQPTSAISRAASASTSSLSARRCASRCAPRDNPFDGPTEQAATGLLRSLAG